MINFGLIVHSFMLIIAFLIILTILFLIIKEWRNFRSLNYYKMIIFLSSIAIAISSHEIVYYNFIHTYGFKPTFF